jgi:hypothetical protein
VVVVVMDPVVRGNRSEGGSKCEENKKARVVGEVSSPQQQYEVRAGCARR